MKTWNKRKVGDLKEKIKKIEKEINMVQGDLMTNPYSVSLKEKNVYFSQKPNQVLETRRNQIGSKIKTKLDPIR